MIFQPGCSYFREKHFFENVDLVLARCKLAANAAAEERRALQRRERNQLAPRETQVRIRSISCTQSCSSGPVILSSAVWCSFSAQRGLSAIRSVPGRGRKGGRGEAQLAVGVIGAGRGYG